MACHKTVTVFFAFSQLTESKSMRSMCQVYAAVSYICIGDPESSSQVEFSVVLRSQLLSVV